MSILFKFTFSKYFYVKFSITYNAQYVKNVLNIFADNNYN